jgi:hypothetical protein
MKQLILDYLKKYNIQLEEYSHSDESDFLVAIKSENEVSPHLEIKIKVVTEKDKCQIYMENKPELGKKFIFDELSRGLIQLINENSEKKVIEYSFKKGWFGWEADNLSINFGVKNEVLGFEARFAI